MSSSKVRLALLLLAVASPCLAGRWSFDLSADLRRDDNVLELSHVERARIGDPAYADRYRLRTAGDTILVSHAGFEWRENLLKQRTTSIALGASQSHYFSNDYLDSSHFSLDVEQELGRDRRPTMNRIGLSLDDVPRTTLRRLKDDDVSLEQGHTVRVDGRYASKKARLFGTVELVPKRLALDLGADREDRDWIPTFHERSGTLDGWDARLAGYVGAKGRVRLRAGFRRESYDANGDDPATALAEDDISSRRRIVSADVRVTWGEREHQQRAWVSLERERRDYSAPSPFDFYHHARQDERFGWELGWRRSFAHDLDLHVSVSGDGNRATFRQPPPPTITPEDATDYDTTVVEIGLAWTFSHREKKH